MANLTGWIFTEMGRQPWVVYGLLKTSDARSPLVSSGEIILRLVGYTLLYGVILVIGGRLFLQGDRQGPEPEPAEGPEPPDARRRRQTSCSPTESELRMRDPNFLQTLWFLLIAVLWIGYFVLEGFDFGVGMLLRFLGRDQAEKRMIVHTIGPVWDGNEVWLLTAGGATFAAFPGWYASLFSGFYIALFLILAALIIRGVSFEFWGKEDSPRWRAGWEWAAAVGSFLAALLWGVGWANIVHGVPMNAHHNVTASLWDLLHPYALLGGLVTLTLFLGHGAIFLSLRTEGELVAARPRLAARVSLPRPR